VSPALARDETSKKSHEEAIFLKVPRNNQLKEQALT
jgi:hypothetical protein